MSRASRERSSAPLAPTGRNLGFLSALSPRAAAASTANVACSVRGWGGAGHEGFGRSRPLGDSREDVPACWGAGGGGATEPSFRSVPLVVMCCRERALSGLSWSLSWSLHCGEGQPLVASMGSLEETTQNGGGGASLRKEVSAAAGDSELPETEAPGSLV